MFALAGPSNKPHAIQTIGSQENELSISRLEVHNSDHESMFVASCMFCVARAVNATEDHNTREDEAHKFLTTIQTGYAIESVRYVRSVLGDSAPAWMFKPEYLR